MRRRSENRTPMRWEVGVFAAAALLLCFPAGCATYERSQRDVEHVVHEWRRQRAVLAPPATQPAVSQSEPAGEPVHPDAPRRPVDTYIQEALERNPGIQAAAAHARAELERIPQVTALPDPVVRAAVRPEPIQTAAGDVFFTLGVSQTFPLLAKLERAGNIAAAETRVALEQLDAKRVQLIADVERAYWQIYRLDRFLEITRTNRQVLEDLEGVVQTQYEVGQVPQQDLLRVQTELAKLRDDEHRYELRRSAAVAALNQLADQAPQRSIPETVTVDPPRVAADVEQLVALAGDHNPELAILRQRIGANREQIELAKLGYWPDLTLGFEWNYLEGREPFIPPVNPQTGQRPPINRKSEVGDDNWAIMLQMNVPIWAQRVEAAKREARQRLLATQSELRNTENLVAFRIFEAWSRVEAQQHTLYVLETELIPQSRQTYEVTLTGYQAGETDFITLIDNWRRWLDFELMRHRETVDLEIAFADLQREVGLQLIRAERSAAPDGE
jgi:cobalt-zinc-cadmium efflux system outer membrane protein